MLYRATPEAVVDNPGLDQSGMGSLSQRIIMFWQKSFTPGVLPATTLPIFPGLEPASENTERCPRWLGYIVPWYIPSLNLTHLK